MAPIGLSYGGLGNGEPINQRYLPAWLVRDIFQLGCNWFMLFALHAGIIPPGTLVGGDYRIERLLAEGGMGSIYVAQQLSTGRPRALKIMRLDCVRDEQLRERFLREARISAAIRSDHIVNVIAAGVDEALGIPWLTMELLEGEDLGASLRRRGPLPPADVLEVLLQLADGLTAAHEAKVVHRDLKPENIFLEQPVRPGATPRVKVLDFGISKVITEATSTTHTAAIGTPHWMAPEQTMDGETITPATDLWPVGLIAFRVLTGKFYWRAANTPPITAMAILREVAVDTLVPASQRAAEYGVGHRIPPNFDKWFARCVERDPALRYQDAAELRADLTEALSTTTAAVASAPRSMPETAPVAAVLPEPPPPPLPSPAREQEAPPKVPEAPAAIASADPAPSRPVIATQPITQTPNAEAPLQPSPPIRSVEPGSRMRWWLAGIAFLAAIALALSFSRFHRAGAGGGATNAPSSSAAPTANNGTAVAYSSSASTSVSGRPVEDPSKIVWQVPIASSPVRGPEAALVTIVEFANFQCPYTHMVEKHLKRLLDQHANELRIVWKDDPLAIHMRANAAASVAREAMAQKGQPSFWAAHDSMLSEGVVLDDAYYSKLSGELGLDGAAVKRSVSERPHSVAINADIDLADSLEVVATPTLFINGRRIAGPLSFEAIQALVDEELLKARTRVQSGVESAGIYDAIMKDAQPPPEPERISVAMPQVTTPFAGPATGDKLVSIQIFCHEEDALCARNPAIVRELLERYPDKIIVAFRSVPPGAQNTSGWLAASAAHEAYEQKGYEGFAKMEALLFEKRGVQGGHDRPAIEAYATNVGLDLRAFKVALDTGEHDLEIREDVEVAKKAGITVMPTFVVGDYVIRGAVPLRIFTRRIDAVISGQPIQ